MSATNLRRSYDVIVVGGGTSGLTVASRLSEDPGIHVLVLEAGGNHMTDPRVTVPALCMQAPGSELDWQFVTVAQEKLKNRKIRQPQGRLLGGSSGINNQSFISPSATGIDAWAKLGNDGWAWAEMEPYYRKFYTLSVPDENTSRHLGLDYVTEKDKEARGPIQVSYTSTDKNLFTKTWVNAFKDMNHGLTGDPFSCESMGGYTVAATVDPSSKTRSYSATAYYAPAAQRTNLSVLTGALVEKIILDGEDGDKTAGSVHFSCEGKVLTVGVGREVILAAGTFQSPKILELSGIGNPHLLKSVQIPVVVDNKNVGENLQDHLMTGVSFEVNDGIPTLDSLIRLEQQAVASANSLYEKDKAGPMTIGGITSHAFMPTPVSNSASNPVSELEGSLKKYLKDTSNPVSELKDLLNEHPEDTDNKLQHDLLSEMIRTNKEATGALFMFPAQTNLHNTESAIDYLQNLQPGNFISLGACQTHVFSRGTSHIVSNNASDAPKIDPRYLSHPLDLEIFARHIQFLERIPCQPGLSWYLKPCLYGKRNHKSAYVKDLDAAKDYARTTAISCYHPVGTCAMLPRDQGGVVNNRLVVYGTRNLRVVDASIMPLIPRSNLQSTVYAVAEKAADLIKADH